MSITCNLVEESLTVIVEEGGVGWIVLRRWFEGGKDEVVRMQLMYLHTLVLMQARKGRIWENIFVCQHILLWKSCSFCYIKFADWFRGSHYPGYAMYYHIAPYFLHEVNIILSFFFFFQENPFLNYTGHIKDIFWKQNFIVYSFASKATYLRPAEIDTKILINWSKYSLKIIKTWKSVEGTN